MGKINLKGSDCLLCGCSYKSTSCSAVNEVDLINLLKHTDEYNQFSHRLVVSDFNYPDILKWDNLNYEREESELFLECLMPQLHLPRSLYDLFVYDFPYDFFGIVGGYKLQRMCLHCLRSPCDFFQRQTRTKPYRDLQISYDYRKVIVQSSCYLHDLPI